MFWGTYDTGKPRVRLLLAGAREAGFEVLECHADVWSGAEDKSQLRGARARLSRLFRWVAAYPSLIWRYLWLPRHDAVVVPYLGQLDVLVLWPFAALRRGRVEWDAFLSLYDTVVEDRRLVGPRSPVAMLLYVLEWLACRAATRVFLDTRAHAEYFERTFRLAEGSVACVAVGAETDVFRARRSQLGLRAEGPLTVLFYGTFIPLHGIDVIVRAALEVERRGVPVRWRLVGTGQQDAEISALIDELGVTTIERTPWIPYDRLIDAILESDVCLGIFGTSGKARRVIPNKVYQILAAGRPLITADTPAIRELLSDAPLTRLVPPGDPAALAGAVLDLVECLRRDPGPKTDEDRLSIGPAQVGEQLLALFQGLEVR